MNEDQEPLLLDLGAAPEFVLPEPRQVKHIEKFIPRWVELPFITAILSARNESPYTEDLPTSPV